jgi:amino acid transporter
MPSPPASAAPPKRFGTLAGVFTPTLLTILGVILYLRLPWVVGNAGLGGALLIVGLGLLITVCTALSLSSIATNTRIGAGGPFAIFSRSLGLEVGGAIGIPLYLTRPLGVAMYIFGFREGLLWVLPELPAMVVDLGLFGVLFVVAFVSADLAFKAQFAIMAVIAVSLVSIVASPGGWVEPVPPSWWGSYAGVEEVGRAPFWTVFAVFFPATTGILTGANMSGELADPRRAIPRGTLAAVGLASVIYLGAAVWASRLADPHTLATDFNVFIDAAFSPGLVLAGLLGATASSALAGLVDGPRILQALAKHRIVPGSSVLARTHSGEPRAAMVVTGVLTVGGVMLRDLNAIAPLLTMFFLLTYACINLVVLLERGLGLVSFRPTLSVPQLVPVVGFVGCVFAMFIINPAFSLVAVGIVVALYVFIHRRGLAAGPADDGVRSSIFVSLAEWAASRVMPADLDNVRAWKPHLLVPVANAASLVAEVDELVDLARPEGSVHLLGLGEPGATDDLAQILETVGLALRRRRVRASWATVDLPDYAQAVRVGTMALQGAFFRPNALVLRQPDPGLPREALADILQTALAVPVGVLLWCPHPKRGLGERRDIRLWVRRGRTGWDPASAFDSGNLNLILLMGFRLWRVWRGSLTLVTIAESPEEVADASVFLDGLCDLARLPERVGRRVRVGGLGAVVDGEDPVDLSVFGLQRTTPDLDWAAQMVERTRGACLFVLDSGRESAVD